MPEALKYFGKSADNGHPQGRYALGSAILRGQGIEVDEKEAVRQFKIAADAGYSVAQCAYAFCLRFGVGGLEPNREERQRYTDLSTRQGGYCPERFLAGAAWDGEKGKVLKKAADEGDALSQYEYAKLAACGDNVPMNLVEAATYYKMSAVAGNGDAQVSYGLCLRNGEGVGVNPEVAVTLFKMAADQGHKRGLFWYGRCLERGEGVKQDVKEGARYVQMALDKHVNPREEELYDTTASSKNDEL
jgi:TPR repeat protein